MNNKQDMNIQQQSASQMFSTSISFTLEKVRTIYTYCKIGSTVDLTDSSI